MCAAHLSDSLGRPLRSLRVSVTDRCNLRCQYCMPEAEYVWLPRDDILSFEETSALVDVFASLGVDRFGASAPYQQLAEAYGFTVDEVVRRARGLLGN